MADDGGNMQAFDAIEFDEFVAFQSMYGRKKLTNILIDKLAEKQLKNGQIEGMGKIGENARKEAAKILNKFADAKERMEEKIYGFMNRHRKQLEIFPKNMKKIKNFLKSQSGNENVDANQFVIACKLFVMKLLSEDGEGSWLDMHSFMSANNYVSSLKFQQFGINKILEKIYEISKYQSPELDFLIIETIYNAHLRAANKQKRMAAKIENAEYLGENELFLEENKNNNNENNIEINENENDKMENVAADQKYLPKFRNVIIEGAGPIGLYTAFRMLLTGNNVLIVNNRQETYLRTRVVFFDPKFMATFRFLLGTEYNKLWIGPKAPGKICCNRLFRSTLSVYEKVNAVVTIGQININRLETALKLRLAALASFAESKAAKQGELSPFRMLYETELVKIQFSTMGMRQQYHAVLGQPQRLTSKAPATDDALQQILMPFDLLICAGGANDQIRNKYLGNPVQLTIPQNYGVVVFNKSKFGQKIFQNPYQFINENLTDMAGILEDLHFQEAITNSQLLLNGEDGIRKKYANIGEQICRGSSPTSSKLNVRLFETNASLHIASQTPAAIEEFFSDIESAKQRHPHQFEAYKEFRIKMERLWSAAVYKFCMQKIVANGKKGGLNRKDLADSNVEIDMDMEGNAGGKFSIEEKASRQVLEFDEHGKLNSGTFSLAIWSARVAVKLLENNKNPSRPAIVAAVGDANTSAHFMTSSGMSTGRLGVDYLVEALQAYHNNKHETAAKLMETLDAKLNSVRKRVLKKALAYVDPIEVENEKNELEKTMKMGIATTDYYDNAIAVAA